MKSVSISATALRSTLGQWEDLRDSGFGTTFALVDVAIEIGNAAGYPDGGGCRAGHGIS